MRVYASLLACGIAMVLALLVAWPAISLLPFPIPGYRNATAGLALNLLAMAAVGFAVWIAVFWDHARRHQLLFALVATACFIYSALFVSISVGIVFSMLAVLVRSK